MTKFKQGRCTNCFHAKATHVILNSNICLDCLNKYAPSLTKLAIPIPIPTPTQTTTTKSRNAYINTIPPFFPSDSRYDAHMLSTAILIRLFGDSSVYIVAYHPTHIDTPPVNHQPNKPMVPDVLNRPIPIRKEPRVVYHLPRRKTTPPIS